MRPRPTVQIQAGTSLFVAVLGLVALQDQGAVAIGMASTAGAVVWAIWGIRYWFKKRSRTPNRPISARRVSGDRAMLSCFAVGLALPLALAWAAAAAHLHLFEPPLHGGQAWLTAFTAMLVVLAVLVSSSVDWYLIRSFREGVWDDPVCKPTVSFDRKERYVRYWILHRLLSELCVYLSVSTFIALIVAIAQDHTKSGTGQDVLSALGPIGILGWTLFEISKLKDALAFIRRPSEAAVGCWVTGRNGDAQDVVGLVLDAAIDPGVQLIDAPRGHPAPDISNDEMSVPLRHRKTLRRVPQPPNPICPGHSCEFWLPDCELGLHLHGDRPYPHVPEAGKPR